MKERQQRGVVSFLVDTLSSAAPNLLDLNSQTKNLENAI